MLINVKKYAFLVRENHWCRLGLTIGWARHVCSVRWCDGVREETTDHGGSFAGAGKWQNKTKSQKQVKHSTIHHLIHFICGCCCWTTCLVVARIMLPAKTFLCYDIVGLVCTSLLYHVSCFMLFLKLIYFKLFSTKPRVTKHSLSVDSLLCLNLRKKLDF